MATLRLRLDGTDLLLPDDEVHYLRIRDGRIEVVPGQPDPTDGDFGYVVSELDNWWLHTNAERRPPTLRVDGRPVEEASVALRGNTAELTLGRPVSAHRFASSRAGAAAGTSGGSPAPPRARRRGDAGRFPETRQWVVGRAGSGADIEIDDPLVYAEHALLEIDKQGRWWVRESAGRVFVNGDRVLSATLNEGTTFVIGQTTVTASPELLTGGVLGPGVAPAGAPASPPGRALRVSAGQGKAVDVNGVTVYGREGRILLDDVDLHIGAGELVAIIGPSGAGKSSLVKLLLGEHQPARGSVVIGGGTHRHGAARPVHRREVRYVPQGDDLYQDLTVRETLAFAARVRAAGEAQEQYVMAQVTKTLTWLGLVEQADTQVKILSGGQRRRVSIGIELVGQPQLLLLDEPTSGLDLGKDRDIISRLRKISREFNCTTLVVTHSVAHLKQVDRLVVMGQGGRVHYSGPPVPPASQGYQSWADWLTAVDQRPPGRPTNGGDGRAHRRPPARSTGSRPTGPGSGGLRPAGLRSVGFGPALLRQALLVARRGWRWFAMLLGLPVLGTLLAIVASGEGLRPGPQTLQVLSVLVTVAALTGAALTYLDLVHERAILKRDWRVGVGAGQLLAAKSVVYGLICVVLSAVITVCFAAIRPLPPPALGIAPALLVFAAMLLTMVSSMGLGLLVSAVADRLEQAVAFNTLLALCQVALNGALFEVPPIPSAIFPARLGLGTIASYLDLNQHRPPGAYHDPLFTNGAVWVPLTLAFMALLGIWATVAAVSVMERRWRV